MYSRTCLWSCMVLLGSNCVTIQALHFFMYFLKLNIYYILLYTYKFSCIFTIQVLKISLSHYSSIISIPIVHCSIFVLFRTLPLFRNEGWRACFLMAHGSFFRLHGSLTTELVQEVVLVWNHLGHDLLVPAVTLDLDYGKSGTRSSENPWKSWEN